MWQESYQIGDMQIDIQHKQLIKTLQLLLQSAHLPNAERTAQSKQTLAFLKDYAVVHFSAEEALQQRIGFADAARHKALHQEYIDTIHSLELSLIAADYDAASTTSMANFLSRWWIQHVILEDKKMKDYL